MRELEDAGRLLGMIEGTKTRGRKPIGYEPIQSADDVRRMMVAEALRNTATGAADAD